MNIRPITLHLAFCITVLVILAAGFWFLSTNYFEIGNAQMVFARCLFFLLCIYTGRWLCNKWYFQNKLPLFLLYTFLCCIGIAISWWLIIKYVFNNRYAGFLEVSISAMPFFVIGLVLGVLIKLIRATMQKQVRDAQVAAEQKQSELNLLQSQLSPHFLFNTLNNLYGISIVQHERVPGLLLKLSDLLRYTVYQHQRTFVPLQEELEYIHNYIDFEKIRIGDRLSLQTDIEKITDPGITIAPMVLIAFIENAFKHAKDALEQKIYIAITLGIIGDEIVFSVTNSYKKQKVESRIIQEHSGLGLVNTIKRLDMLYASRYKLKQSGEDGVYTVRLRLQILYHEQDQLPYCR